MQDLYKVHTWEYGWKNLKTYTFVDEMTARAVYDNLKNASEVFRIQLEKQIILEQSNQVNGVMKP